MTPRSETILPEVLRTLVADPGRPRLTWYGPGGERIELSGHVLVNWVIKTTNLLLEEFDAAPGSRVLVDLPPHWRTVVWALAVWRTGACLVLPNGGPSACDVVATDRPDRYLDGTRTEVVAVALPALARRWDGELPRGALDAAAAVMTYGDALGREPRTDPASDALSGRAQVAHSGLMTWAANAGAPVMHRTAPHEVAGRRSDRVLLEPLGRDVDVMLAAALTTLAADGSVVILDPEVSEALALDADRREALIATERVTA